MIETREQIRERIKREGEESRLRVEAWKAQRVEIGFPSGERVVDRLRREKAERDAAHAALEKRQQEAQLAEHNAKQVAEYEEYQKALASDEKKQAQLAKAEKVKHDTAEKINKLIEAENAAIQYILHGESEDSGDATAPGTSGNEPE